MATNNLINNTRPVRNARSVTKHSRKEIKEQAVRDYDSCFDCINYNAASEHTGACAYRLNSPDYPTYTVGKFELTCDSFNVPATQIDTNNYETRFPNMPTQVNFEARKDSGIRAVLDLRILSVPDLHRLGRVDQQYPVLAATIEHNGETCVFILPNTKVTKVPYGEPVETLEFLGKTQRTVTRQREAKVPVCRYDLTKLFTKVSASGKVTLGNWSRIQFDK